MTLPLILCSNMPNNIHVYIYIYIYMYACIYMYILKFMFRYTDFSIGSHRNIKITI